jgi:hypothetical protein
MSARDHEPGPDCGPGNQPANRLRIEPQSTDQSLLLSRAQTFHVLQLKRIERLMRAMADLVPQGFVPLGLNACLIQGPVLLVETPPDDLVDRLKLRLCGNFSRDRGPCIWFLHEGVRVEWHPAVEGPRRPFPLPRMPGAPR